MRKGKKPGVKKGYKRGPMSAAHRKAISEASKRRFAKQARPDRKQAPAAEVTRNGFIRLTAFGTGVSVFVQPEVIKVIRATASSDVLGETIEGRTWVDIAGSSGVLSSIEVLESTEEVYELLLRAK